MGNVEAGEGVRVDASFIDGAPKDGKAVINSMYGADSEMAAGIESVVNELENYGKDGSSGSVKKDGAALTSADVKRQKKVKSCESTRLKRLPETWLTLG